jgi:hypothetical protein
LTPMPHTPYTPGMLRTKDIVKFKEYIESGQWADAFGYASEDLRLEMIEKIEELLDAADAADKVVGEVLFSKDGMPPAEAGQSGLPAASQSEPAKE